MKQRQLLIIVTLTSGMPIFILGAQFAGSVLPVIPAVLIGGALCGGAAYLLGRSFWKLIND